MYPRTNYEMTPADLEALMEAMTQSPMMIIGGFGPRSVQEKANSAWAELGLKMGFDPMTVQPNGKGNRFFSAVPSETDLQRTERLTHEAEEKRLNELANLEKEIATLTERRAALLGNTPTA